MVRTPLFRPTHPCCLLSARAPRQWGFRASFRLAPPRNSMPCDLELVNMQDATKRLLPLERETWPGRRTFPTMQAAHAACGAPWTLGSRGLGRTSSGVHAPAEGFGAAYRERTSPLEGNRGLLDPRPRGHNSSGAPSLPHPLPFGEPSLTRGFRWSRLGSVFHTRVTACGPSSPKHLPPTGTLPRAWGCPRAPPPHPPFPEVTGAG